MNEINLSNSSKEKPLLTLILLAYNQEQYIRDAIDGALSQTYHPLEIILSDDHSIDNTYSIINEIANSYNGPHTIVLNRNEKNIGLAAHYNKLLGIARGEIILSAAGDDISLPDRVEKTYEIFKQYNEAYIVSFKDSIININGNIVGQKPTFSTIKEIHLNNLLSNHQLHLSGASRAIRKTIFVKFGNLESDCPTEDTPYILRGLMLGSAIVSPESAIKYRIHDKNLSSPNSLSTINVKRITNQYKTDVKKAYLNGLIDIKTKNKISKWIDFTYINRITNQSLHKANYKLLKFLITVALNNDFSATEKLLIINNSFNRFIATLKNKCK